MIKEEERKKESKNMYFVMIFINLVLDVKSAIIFSSEF
jgi:hypothetical protein